ncbi:MAG: nuclear transport factor 2 family protein [Candidatus Bathyarchaeia archaeon]
MPFCLKCGRELYDEVDFCISCAGSSTTSPGESQIQKKILLVFVLLDLVAACGLMYYLFQPQAPAMEATPSPIQTWKPPIQPTYTPTSTPGTVPPLKSPSTPIEGEENRIREMLRLFFDALNRHSVDEVVSYFADDVEILINHGRDYSYKGPKVGLSRYLLIAFTLAPDAEVTDVKIDSIEVVGDEAKVRVSYLVSSKTHSLSRTAVEDFDLVKMGSSWKIVRTDITY